MTAHFLSVALRAGFVFLTVGTVAAAASVGCSSKTTATVVDAGPPPCDQTKCLKGNFCIDDGTGLSKCRLPCAAAQLVPNIVLVAGVATVNTQVTITASNVISITVTTPGNAPGAKYKVTAIPGPPGTGSFVVTAVDVNDVPVITDTSTLSALISSSVSDCPFNTTCIGLGSSGFCSADKTPYTQGKGLWGASCLPSGGIDNNPACDFSQGFRCLAASPTDGNAFCTQFQCGDDTDCKGGWWCATANVAPNALNPQRSLGATFKVCKPRDYCAPCATDVDCAGSGGIKEHCIADVKGGSYCSPECKQDSNCNNEAQCVSLDANQGAPCGSATTCACAARARVCVGDGSLCAPCLSDGDCPNGFCIKADYSSEHFCGVKSGIPCTYDSSTMKVTSQCPTTNQANARVGCETQGSVDIPKDECIGVVDFAGSGVAGCYTPKRL